MVRNKTDGDMCEAPGCHETEGLIRVRGKWLCPNCHDKVLRGERENFERADKIRRSLEADLNESEKAREDLRSLMRNV